MRTAYLPSGKLVSADEYEEMVHGYDILCMDKTCRAPLVFVPKSEKASAHFKTVGKSAETKHTASCGFYQPLDIIEAIEKVAEYQADVLESSIKKTLISLNMRRLDPEYEPKKTEREGQHPGEND